MMKKIQNIDWEKKEEKKANKIKGRCMASFVPRAPSLVMWWGEGVVSDAACARNGCAVGLPFELGSRLMLP